MRHFLGKGICSTQILYLQVGRQIMIMKNEQKIMTFFLVSGIIFENLRKGIRPVIKPAYTITLSFAA
jgi:hypothetical protein